MLDNKTFNDRLKLIRLDDEKSLNIPLRTFLTACHHIRNTITHNSYCSTRTILSAVYLIQPFYDKFPRQWFSVAKPGVVPVGDMKGADTAAASSKGKVATVAQ